MSHHCGPNPSPDQNTGASFVELVEELFESNNEDSGDASTETPPDEGAPDPA